MKKNQFSKSELMQPSDSSRWFSNNVKMTPEALDNILQELSKQHGEMGRDELLELYINGRWERE